MEWTFWWKYQSFLCINIFIHERVKVGKEKVVIHIQLICKQFVSTSSTTGEEVVSSQDAGLNNAIITMINTELEKYLIASESEMMEDAIVIVPPSEGKK